MSSIRSILLFALALVVAGCDQAPDSEKLERLHVSATHTNKPGSYSEREVDEILSQYDAKLSKDPKNLILLEERMAFALAHRPEAAVAYGKELLKQNPDHYYALTSLARALLSQGELGKAHYYAGQAFRVRKDADTMFLVGQVYEAQGLFEQAKRFYTMAIQESPDHAGAKNRLAELK